MNEPTRVVFCVPTVTRPFQPFLDAMEAACPALDAAGLHHQIVWEVGCPYISSARATMLRKALDAKADVIVFLDHDISFRPEDLLKLIQTEGDVVAGLYRFKIDAEEYMGGLETLADGLPIVRADGCVRAIRVPAGFLKITSLAVHRFIKAYPHLTFGPSYSPSIDLFNHGAHEGAWFGEDYAFSRNWLAQGGDIWVVPDLNLTHHSPDKAYPGNFHRFLLAQPGGSEDPAREAP